ncbi:MAG: ribosome maturation factor RimP [Candidatus Methylomirabilales bacterium]
MAQAAAEIVERVRRLALGLAGAEGIELVDVEFRREQAGWVLRLYLDRPGGIQLDDCQRVSEQLSDLLDVEAWIDHPYTLEVSSPGLDRPLKSVQDFLRFAGRRARVTTRAPIGNQRNFRGRIEGVREARVFLQLEQGEVVAIPLEGIAKARLEIEL